MARYSPTSLSSRRTLAALVARAYRGDVGLQPPFHWGWRHLRFRPCCDHYDLPVRGSSSGEQDGLVRVLVRTEDFETVVETSEVGNHIHTVRYERVD